MSFLVLLAGYTTDQVFVDFSVFDWSSLLGAEFNLLRDVSNE